MLSVLGPCDLRQLYRAREVTASEVVSEVLDRIREVSASTGAIRRVTDDLAEQGARMSDSRFRAGCPRPLEGVPFTVKCVLTRYWHGPRMGDEGNARIFSALVDAGAVPIGVSEASRFAVAVEADRPRTLVQNPRLLGRSAGDSSDGAASAVASGLGPIAVGTDTTGSVRSPAALCGVVGLKPTHGSVSILGAATISAELDDIGFLGRRVSDTRELHRLARLSCPGDRRGWTAEFSNVRWGIRSRGGDGLRLGVLVDRSISESSLETAAEFERTVDRLADTGVAVTSIPMACVADCLESARVFMGAGVVAESRRAAAAGWLLTSDTLARAHLGSEITTKDLVEASAARASAMRAFDAAFDMCDVLLLPANGCVAPTHEEYEQFRLGSSSKGINMVSPFNRVASVTGLPAVTMPVGSGEGDLPIGIQLLAPWGAEELLFEVGALLEGVFGTGLDHWGIEVRRVIA